MLKKSLISMAMVGAVALALASSGGGDKKKVTVAASGVNTLKTTPGFSLKAGRSYSNSLTLKNGQNNLALVIRYLLTEKEIPFTFYLLPARLISIRFLQGTT